MRLVVKKGVRFLPLTFVCLYRHLVVKKKQFSHPRYARRFHLRSNLRSNPSLPLHESQSECPSDMGRPIAYKYLGTNLKQS